MDLLSFFKKAKQRNLSKTDLVEASVCPNCWGIQEYEGKFRALIEDPQKAALNHDPSAQKAFVQQFMEDHITGIRLKSEGEILRCPACKGGYKKVSNHAN